MKLTAEEFVKKYPFIHLHNHTDKSFKDGHSTFDSVIDRCIECDMPGIAVTEHGNMFDAMGFDIKAKKAGIKHIFGCEVYVLPEGDSTTVLRDNNPDEKSDNIYVKNFHLIVLAYNRIGLTNLHKLLSVANDCGYEGASVGDHFYYTARVKFEELEKYKEGLIVSSACMGGEVPRLIAQGRIKEAIRVAKRYHEVFGDNYYLEIMDHEDKKGRCIEGQYEVNKKLIAISQKFGIKLLLTNDCHYTRRSDYEGHKLLKCVSYNEEYYNAQNYNKYYPTKEFYIKSSLEMLTIAKKYGKPGIEAYRNTYRIYQQCNVEIDTHLHFPHAILPEGEQDSSDFLRKLVFKLAPIKYNMDDEQVASVVTARIEKELKDIDRGQFPDYFLNTYEIVKYAKENEILIGAGRGSGAGSIVANILNITDVDPLEFDLIWERFWNPGRCQFAEDGKTIIKASPPDIDIDVASTRRAEVIEFVKEHFGYHRVASIAVFGTFKAYALINAASKVLHTPEDIVEQVKKAIPYMGSPTLAECLEECQELINLYDSNDEVREFIDKLKLIDGRAVNVGTHAGGVLITDKDMYEYTPIFNGKNGFTTQYPYETLEAIGCLKIDLLGHELETIIDRACMLIKERHGITINPYSIPFEDNKTYKMLKDIRLNGVPQLQADWVIPIIQNVQPDNIGDVIDLVTMIRPGSLNSGQTDKYQKYCLGEPVKPDVPELSPIVKDYKNCLLYQEQIMNLAVQLGGFTLEEADQLRKVCAKTKYADLAKPLLEKLESGMEKNKIPHRHILKILEIVKSFFSYSFNKAHAAGYGISTYRIAWLKANYFLELQCAQLNSIIGDLEKSAKFLDELIAEDYKIYPPDINTSTFMWECRDDGVVMPINLIKGVGDTCAKAIVEERELKGDYKSFEDFVQRTPGKSVKKNNIQNMILCGAFDCFGLKRKALYDASEEYIAQLRETSKKKLFAQKPTHYDFYNGAEFTSFDIKEYEKSLLGINVTLSEHDLALKKKKIRARQTKLKAKVNTSRKHFEQKSKSKSQTDNVQTAKTEPKVVVRHDDESDVDNVVQSNSKARNRLSDLINNSQPVEAPVQKESEKSLTITISDSLNFKFKLLKKLLDKYSENGDCQLKFVFFTKDKEVFSISTNTFVKLNDELLSKLKSRYGEDSFFVN